MQESAAEKRFRTVFEEAKKSVENAEHEFAKGNRSAARDELLNAISDFGYINNYKHHTDQVKLKELNKLIAAANKKFGELPKREITHFVGQAPKNYAPIGLKLRFMKMRLEKVRYAKPPTETFRDWFYSQFKPKIKFTVNELQFPNAETGEPEAEPVQPIGYHDVKVVDTLLSRLNSIVTHRKREPVRVRH